jgi:hypothetical protein
VVVTLGEGARARLAIVLQTMLGEPPAIAGDCAAYFDEYLRRVPAFAALGLRLIVWALLWMPLFFVGRPQPASALPEEVRVRYLSRWANAKSYHLREGFFLVKAVALFAWGAHPTVRARYEMP